MRRRAFIKAVGGTALALAWPIAARVQSGKSSVRIGFIFFGSQSNAYDQSLVKAFREGLRQVGLVENQDIVLDVVWTTALWGARHPGQLQPVDEVSGWSIDASAKAEIDRILSETIADPIGPEFMAPDARNMAA